MTDATHTIRIGQVVAVLVPVTDQERAVEFYLHTLGFEKRADFPTATASAPPGAANIIALVAPREG